MGGISALFRRPVWLFHLFLVALGIVWIYPFVWMITASLKTKSEYISAGLSLLPKSIQFENYVRAWKTAHFSTYFFNTIIVTVSVVVIVIGVCSLTGYALGRYQFKGRILFMAAVTATMFMPKGYTIIPVYSLINVMGLNNTL